MEDQCKGGIRFGNGRASYEGTNVERKGKAQGPSLRTDGWVLGPELTEKAEPQQFLCSRNLGSLKGGLAWGGEKEN